MSMLCGCVVVVGIVLGTNCRHPITPWQIDFNKEIQKLTKQATDKQAQIDKLRDMMALPGYNEKVCAWRVPCIHVFDSHALCTIH